MPHLRINYKTAKRIGEEYGLRTAEQTADFLGINVDHVRFVCEQFGPPSDEFIAACLLKIPTRFDDLFEIVDCSAAA